MAIAIFFLLSIPVIMCDPTKDIVEALRVLDDAGLEMDDNGMKCADNQPKLDTLRNYQASSTPEEYLAKDFLLWNVCNARKPQWGVFETWTQDEHLLNPDTYFRQFAACSNCIGWSFMRKEAFKDNQDTLKARYSTEKASKTFTALSDAGMNFYQKQSPGVTLAKEFIRQSYNDSQSNSRRQFCNEMNDALTTRRLEKSEWMCLIACKVLGDLDNDIMHETPKLRRQSSMTKRANSFKKQNSGGGSTSSGF